MNAPSFGHCMIRFPHHGVVGFGRDVPEEVNGLTSGGGHNECTDPKDNEINTDDVERVSEETLAGSIRGEDAMIECQNREFDQSEAWALEHDYDVGSLPELLLCMSGGCSSGMNGDDNKKFDHIPAKSE